MEVKLINQTNYANIYWVVDETGKTIGTVEQRLAGGDCGTYCRTWSGNYTSKDIQKIWNQHRKECR